MKGVHVYGWCCILDLWDMSKLTQKHYLVKSHASQVSRFPNDALEREFQKINDIYILFSIEEHDQRQETQWKKKVRDDSYKTVLSIL